MISTSSKLGLGSIFNPRSCSPTLVLSALVVLTMFVGACGGDGSDAADADVELRPAAGGKNYGGIYTANVLRGDPNGLDPVLINSKHADDISSQVYDRLVDLDSNLELIPELAVALPQISDDGRTYTFTLRSDVYFHDSEAFPDGKGRRLTAEDVKYSFTRCCDPRTKTVAFWAFQDKVKGATEYFNAIAERGAGADVSDLEVEGFRAVDDTTFVIELIEPYAPFVYYLVNSLGGVVAREAVEHYGADYFQNPVGTGPFIFEEWLPGQHIAMKRNPNYWDRDEAGNQLPLLDGLRFTFIKDDKVQLREFEIGKLSESYNIPTEHFTDVYDAKTGTAVPPYDQYQLQAVPAMLTWFFDFNVTRPPFDDRRVRRAFNHAIDRQSIVEYVLLGSPYGPARNGLVPPVFPGYPHQSVSSIDFDPQKGRQLLAEAGYPDGAGFPAVEMYIYGEPRLVQVAEALQDMLAKNIGVNVQIKQLEFSQMISQADAGKLSFWGTRWYGDYPDVETYLTLLNGALVPASDTMPSYPNSTRYNNPEFNRIFQQAVATTDAAERMSLYARAEQIAVDDAPIIPLFYERHYRLLQPQIRDTPLDAMARYDGLKRTWMSSAGGR